MATDNKASYTVVGFTVLIGFAAIAAVLIRFGGLGGDRNVFVVETYYDNPVDGLSVGSAVNFRGVKVGEVRDIDFASCVYDTEEVVDRQRVIIEMALDVRRLGMDAPEDRATIRERLKRAIGFGLRATVKGNAVTGLAKIEIGVVPEPLPVAKLAWTPRHPLIPPQPSLMDSIGDAATKILHQLNKMDFLEAWSNVNNTAESAAHVSSQLDLFIQSQRFALGSIVENVDQASASVRDLVETVKANPARLLRGVDPTPLPETTP